MNDDAWRADQSHFRDGHWPGSRRRRRAGSGQRRRPELRPRHNGSRPVDQSGSRAASRRRSRSPLHLRRRARGQPARHASCSPGRCSAPPRPQMRPASSFRPPARVWPWRSARCRSRAVSGWSASSGCSRDSPDDTATAPPPHLTPRQVEVLRLLEQGRSTKQIAAELHVSTETVRNHIRRLFRALGVHSRLEAVAAARASHRPDRSRPALPSVR